MFCPFCTSEHVVPNGVGVMGLDRLHCTNCGENWLSYPDEDALEACEIFGHDWQEYELADGTTYDECGRCGLITD